jgi:hypothetical protein
VSSLDQSRIGLSTAAQAGAGAAAIGSTLTSVGKQSQQSNQLNLSRQLANMVDVEATRLFEESKQAHQSATLLNKTTDATEAFIKAATKRYSTTVDEKGNPTFDRLHTDIEEEGRSIMEQTAKTIADPQVAEMFRQRFSGYVANQKISALKHGLKQQVQFGRDSLDSGLGKLVQQASTDTIEQVASYEQEGISSLNQALAGGIISEEEHAGRTQEFSSVVRQASIQSTIDKDRTQAAEYLSLSAEELGIDEESKGKLDSNLKMAIASDLSEAEKAAEIQEIDDAAEEAALVGSIESRIEAGALREDELVKLEGHVSDKKYKDLKKQYIRVAEKQGKERQELRDLGVRVASGDDISDVKPAAINKYYDHAIKLASDKLGRPLNLEEEARLATSIPSPVSDYAAKLETNVKTGSLDKAEEIIGAYSYINDLNKPTLDSKFDSEAATIVDHAQQLVERGGLDPKEALSSARELVFNSDERTRQIRIKTFKDEKAFKSNNIQETAASDLDAETFLGTNLISREDSETYKELVSFSYQKHGDLESARNFAKNQMKKTHGYTSINGSEQFMFEPPEKHFPDLTSGQIRTIMEKEAQPLLPEGVDASSIVLISDQDTPGRVQVTGTKEGKPVKRQIPTWTMNYTLETEEGPIIVPLTDPKTLQPMRWTPAGTDVLSEQIAADQEETAQGVSEAKAKREARIAEEGKLSPAMRALKDIDISR